MNDNKFFCLICFLVLMQNDQGILSKAPDYIQEKFKLPTEDVDFAMGSLDLNNQEKVVRYYRMWKIPLPELVQIYVDRMGM